MPFPKKLLYYGLLAALTLLVVEGMARAAYWLAFEQADSTQLSEFGFGRRPKHPFYGFIYGYTYGRPGDNLRGIDHDLSVMPPRQKRDDLVLIGLFGGSVAQDATPYLQAALSRYFAANRLPRQPVVLELGLQAVKEPQQVMMAANALLLGGHYDLIINLDGYNELLPEGMGPGTYPFLPFNWNNITKFTAAEYRLAGRVSALRGELGELQRAAAAHPLRWTAVYQIVNRYRRQETERRIIQANHAIQAVWSAYQLEKHGPHLAFQTASDLNRATLRAWYRSSLLLAATAELAGAEYYHFLQPNQYIPGSKPLTARELECCYQPDRKRRRAYQETYPELAELGAKLPGRQVNYFDLTQIFRDNRETLYRDHCCHFNERGNELLTAAMVERLAPALQRMGKARPPVSGLDAAAVPAELLMDGYFRVYRRAGNRLLYVRENCAPADVAAAFFLHIIPKNAADLPPERREYGFDNQDFRFSDAGHLTGGRCAAERQLPAYAIAAIRTGQYVEGAGKLWESEYRFAE